LASKPSKPIFIKKERKIFFCKKNFLDKQKYFSLDTIPKAFLFLYKKF